MGWRRRSGDALMSSDGLSALGGIAKSDIRSGVASRSGEAWLTLLIATAWEQCIRVEAEAEGREVVGFGLGARVVGWPEPTPEVIDAFTESALRGLGLTS